MTHPQRSAPHPAIVVVAYNRPASLTRLLTSLGGLNMPDGVEVPLIVSVDDGTAECVEIASEFTWLHGPKEIIARPRRLGLREHVLACGDLSERFGSVIVLEDDLYVAPGAYRYVTGAIDHYADEPTVAGISLYSFRIDEYLGLAFYPLDDGYDTFFMQTPSSSGQAWTSGQWRGFRKWLEAQPYLEGIHLPEQAAGWDRGRSWKKLFLAYLIDTDRYYTFPRVGLTTNCGDPGTHFSREAINTATPVFLGTRDWRFAPWRTNSLRYDAWFEPHSATIERWWPELGGPEVTIDFFGSKDRIDTPMLLSSRPCTAPVRSFPMILLPFAQNLSLPGEGAFFHFGHAAEFAPLPPPKRRRIFEASNGQIGRDISAGILWDRLVQRITRDTRDHRLTD